MATIKAFGEAVVVTSAMKMEDLELIKKYRPEALTLKGGEDGKQPIFAVGVTNGTGSMNVYGASFNGTALDGSGKAVLTMHLPKVADVKEWIADNLGAGFENLEKLEKTLPAVVTAITEARNNLMEKISMG